MSSALARACQATEDLRPEQRLHRVRAENDAKMVAPGGSSEIRVASAAPTPCARSPARNRPREPLRQADDHQREEDADREDGGGVQERRVHPAADAALVRREAVHHGGPVRRREEPHADAFQEEHEAELGIPKSTGSRSSQTKQTVEMVIPAVANDRAP